MKPPVTNNGSKTSNRNHNKPKMLAKATTGIQGLDEITGGGLPAGAATLVTGGPGCGKTLMALEFLVRGATQFGEPGVFVAFEETASELTRNVASLGFDLDDLVRRKKLHIEEIRIEPEEIEEAGEYDLEALFIRLDQAIQTTGARRIVLDTVEVLLCGLCNAAILRSELRRLFRWLKDRGITTIVTGERHDGPLSQHRLEEYVSDCVIQLDHRVQDQVSTRRLRVVKYRGSAHGTNEYPFLVNEHGISVLPVTSLRLDFVASKQRVSSGVPRLDTMLGGHGYFRGSSVLVSGTAGSGKTSLAANFAAAACQRGERAIYFAFEESAGQVIRNMRSIGLDLEPFVRRGLLRFHMARPTHCGLEMHLAIMHNVVSSFKPQVVILDPVNSFSSVGSPTESKSMLNRLVDFLKVEGITSLFTNLLKGGDDPDQAGAGISSLMDTWLLVQAIEANGERNRVLYLLKSRGMAHSNQVREFRLTDKGVELCDVYVGPNTVLTGSARLAQEANDRSDKVLLEQKITTQQRALDRKRAALEAQIAALRADFEAEKSEMQSFIQQGISVEATETLNEKIMSRHRGADGLPARKHLTRKL